MRPTLRRVVPLLAPVALAGFATGCESDEEYYERLEPTVGEEELDPNLRWYEPGDEIADPYPERTEFEAFIERTEARLDAIDDWTERIGGIQEEMGERLEDADEEDIRQLRVLRTRLQESLAAMRADLDQWGQPGATPPGELEENQQQVEERLKAAEQQAERIWKDLQERYKEE